MMQREDGSMGKKTRRVKSGQGEIVQVEATHTLPLLIRLRD